MANDFSNFYESFYSTFLTTANGLPINSMWLVQTDAIPTEQIKKSIGPTEGWAGLGNTQTQAALVATNPKGLIIATGVKVVGDSVEVSREGAKNHGYIQGLVGKGRTGFPLLNIAFVENNVSFVDYVLRPWEIAVSHKSLKDQSLKINVDVKFLTRTGPNSPIAIRKHVKYINCCPVNIDEQEYNYSGSDMYKIRQVQFAFEKYEILSAGDGILGLMGGGSVDDTIKKALGGAGNVNDDGDGFFDKLTNRLKGELQRQFGADTIGQYATNVASRAKSFGSDLLATTATSIVTNAAGGVQGLVDSAVQSLESSAAGLGRDLVGSVDDTIKKALGGAGNVNDDTVLFSTNNTTTKTIESALDSATSTAGTSQTNKLDIHKKTKPDDTPAFVKTIKVQNQGNPSEVDVNIPVTSNDVLRGPRSGSETDLTLADANSDTVQLDTNLKGYVEKPNPSSSDNRHGEINHEDVIKNISQNDNTLGVNSVSNALTKNTNQNDARTGKQLLNDDTIIQRDPINQNHSLVGYVEKQTNQNDHVKKNDRIPYVLKTIKKPS